MSKKSKFQGCKQIFFEWLCRLSFSFGGKSSNCELYKIPVPKDTVYTIKLRLILGVIKLLGVKVDLVIQYVFMFNTSQTKALIHRYKNIYIGRLTT